jgi:hypothetical protein
MKIFTPGSGRRLALDQIRRAFFYDLGPAILRQSAQIGMDVSGREQTAHSTLKGLVEEPQAQDSIKVQGLPAPPGIAVGRWHVDQRLVDPEDCYIHSQ